MREYELVLMLDPGQDAPARDAVAQEAKRQIEAAGTLKHENAWGLRKLAYEIKRCNEADYRWFRFEAPTELLEQLDHNLKIADGVLRFRIFKVDADTPVTVPPATAAPGPSSSRERRDGGESAAPRDEAEGAPAETAVAEAPAETAVAEAPAETAVAEPAPEAAVAEPPAETADEAAPPEPSGDGAGDEPAKSAE
jgi:small subunit ribosomal protein S6